MTVAELRKALEGLPDDLQIIRRDETFLLLADEAVTVFVKEFDDDSDRLGLGEIDAEGSAYFLIG